MPFGRGFVLDFIQGICFLSSRFTWKACLISQLQFVGENRQCKIVHNGIQRKVFAKSFLYGYQQEEKRSPNAWLCFPLQIAIRISILWLLTNFWVPLVTSTLLNSCKLWRISKEDRLKLDQLVPLPICFDVILILFFSFFPFFAIKPHTNHPA